ncbi:MAG: hypothetical protein QOK38_3728 [Acidobacteriaceae bacterium]|nr:hypothetical protein [Acidobacteriaceae bacterium]
MYPECRHVRPSGDTCRAAAIQGSHWCYFHARMHERQTIRHNRRQTNGRFAPMAQLDRGSLQPSHPETRVPHSERSEGWDTTQAGSATETSAASPSGATRETALQTIDYGTYPVGATRETDAEQSLPLQLPPVEDTESIQLALIDVLQALAANQLDPKRASLLLYGLQVASANAKHLNIPSHGVRTVTYTSDGIALAPQDYGWDIEDIEEEANCEEEDDDEEE